MMAIYQAAQWILVNDAPFTHVSVFSNSQAAIKSLSGFVGNSRIVSEYRRCLNLFLAASPVYQWCGSLGTATFRETVGQTNPQELVHSFRNPLRLNCVFNLPRPS